jgi:hypothetical protein
MSKFSYYGFLLLIVVGILYTVERIVFYIFYYLYVSRIPEKPCLWSNVFVLLFLVIGLHRSYQPKKGQFGQEKACVPIYLNLRPLHR